MLTFDGPIKIEQHKWHNHHLPISDAPIVKEYTAAYIHHLFQAHESVGLTLATIHNIDFMMKFMARSREMILNDLI